MCFCVFFPPFSFEFISGVTGTTERDGETHGSLATAEGLWRDSGSRKRREGTSRAGKEANGGKNRTVDPFWKKDYLVKDQLKVLITDLSKRRGTTKLHNFEVTSVLFSYLYWARWFFFVTCPCLYCKIVLWSQVPYPKKVARTHWKFSRGQHLFHFCVPLYTDNFELFFFPKEENARLEEERRTKEKEVCLTKFKINYIIYAS